MLNKKKRHFDLSVSNSALVSVIITLNRGVMIRNV